MPRTPPEADLIAPYAIEAQEQAQCWRELMAGLPADWVTSATAPLLVEFCRHIIYARQVAEELTRMRKTSLSGTQDAEIDRAIFLQFAQMAREESRVIADLALKLRFCKQTRLNSVTAENARKRLHNGPKPWEVIVGGASDDDDDDDQGPATTN
jgi:hypothetical protein